MTFLVSFSEQPHTNEVTPVAQHAWHHGVIDQCRWPVCHPWLVLPVPRVVGWYECPAPAGTASRTAPFRCSPAWGPPATHCFGVAGRGSTARRTTRRVRLVAVAVVARAHKVSRGLAGWVSVFRTSLPSKLMKAVKVLGLAVLETLRLLHGSRGLLFLGG